MCSIIGICCEASYYWKSWLRQAKCLVRMSATGQRLHSSALPAAATIMLWPEYSKRWKTLPYVLLKDYCNLLHGKEGTTFTYKLFQLCYSKLSVVENKDISTMKL